MGANRPAILGRRGWRRTDQLFWVARHVRRALRWSNTQLDNSVTVIYQIIMKGQRDCRWLLIGSLNHCGESCPGEYCKEHLARIRRESPIPIPCQRCSKGPQSETNRVDVVEPTGFKVTLFEPKPRRGASTALSWTRSDTVRCGPKSSRLWLCKPSILILAGLF